MDDNNLIAVGIVVMAVITIAGMLITAVWG